jgi:putative membrane protein
MRLGFLVTALGIGAVAALVGWYGAQEIGRHVLAAVWVIPPVILLHAVQLHWSAIAWQAVIGVRRPGPGVFLLVRWIRESVNSVLPVAQLGGNIVGIRLLMHRGVSGAQAGAGTTIDLTLEALTQGLFTILGVAVLAASEDQPWAPWLRVVVGVTISVGVLFLLAQRAGLLRLVEAAAERLGRLFPGLPAGALRGLHAELVRLQRERNALLWAGSLHFAAWLLGVAESWLALAAMGAPASLSTALIVESIGMAARSAGFAVPGALGVQEAGFILAGELCGLPADAAVALSMIKRARELLVGLPGVLAWQWLEGRRVLSR